jgi:hypothetical protein
MSPRGEALRDRMMALEAREEDRPQIEALSGAIRSLLIARRAGDTDRAHRWLVLAEDLMTELEQRARARS